MADYRFLGRGRSLRRGEKSFHLVARVCDNAGAHGVRAGLLSNRFRSELAQMHAIVSFLVAVTFVCMPGMAYATDAGDGFSGSEGGSFNIGQIWDAASSDWSSFDWYIGSVFDHLFGGGGGHAFSGDAGAGSGDAGAGSGGTGATTGNPATTSSTFTVTLTNCVARYSSSSTRTTVNGVDYTLWESVDSSGTVLTPSSYPRGNTLQVTLSGVNTDVYKYYFIYLSPRSGTNFTYYAYVSDTPFVISKEGNTISLTCSGSTKWDFNASRNISIDAMPFSASLSVYPSRNQVAATLTLNAGCLYATSGTVGGDGSSTGGDGSSTGGGSSSTGGDSSSTGDDYTYPSDDDWPEPSVPTTPSVNNPTVGEVTETSVDLSPVTNRQDIANTLLYAISSNDAALYNMLVAEFDQFEREVYDLGDFLGRYLYLVSTGIKTLHDDLGEIETALGTLDHDTDAIDLTGVNSKLDQLISALGNQTPYDDGGVITAITGSHGTDLLGLFGRLDTISNWLDAYTGFDDTNLRTTIENAAYDDTGLLSAITGSHGSDLLGLFGRLDLITNWLDAYTGYDDSGLMALLQDVYGALHNLQDGDSGFNTLRGDVRALLNDFDNLMSVLEEWPDYPITDLTAIQTYLDSMLGELSAHASDFIQYWSVVSGKLDDIVRAIEMLDFKYPPTGNPNRPSQRDLSERINWDEWDNAVSTLMHKFPFSIVNDMIMIFTALTRPAQTPAFDLPMPNPDNWSEPYMVHVDLSDFDVMAAVMRVGILLWVISRVSRRTLSLFASNEGGAV